MKREKQAIDSLLRAKVEEAHQKKSLMQRHWVKLALGVVTAVVLGSGAWAYVHTRTVNRGRDLQDALTSARKAFEGGSNR